MDLAVAALTKELLDLAAPQPGERVLDKVDPELGQIRATRLVGAFAAGTIINPRLVRSHGMIWGLSFVLHEAAVLDPRSGRVMNANLAEYHVPVNADVPSLEAILVEEDDPHVNALSIKGVGEIGITGTAGAIANAVARDRGSRPPLSDHPRSADRSPSGLASIPVMLGLEGAGARQVEIVGLRGAEGRQHDSELVEVECCNLSSRRLGST
jgi:hypothetical protein